MNDGKNNKTPYVASAIIAGGFLYALFYFNYFETPTGDYIGNILPRVLEYMKGNFPGQIYKFLPLYPLILALLTAILPVRAEDPVYFSAMILNLSLFVPYLIVVYRIYGLFLEKWQRLGAMLFLVVNMYTIYTAVNSELEMLLSLLCALTVYLSLIDSPFSYVAAFFASTTKWDAVFTVPAAMFRDFFFRKKRIFALAAGTIAASGVALWLLASILNSRGSHPYVAEIAQRGPNIYRYFIDCFLVTGGFIQWAAVEGYYSTNAPLAVYLFFLAGISGLVTVICTIWGGYLFIRKHGKVAAPLLVFLAGFLIIHVIYQNTKDRYVLPILWLLVLFFVTGFTEGLFPKIQSTMKKVTGHVKTILWIGAIALLLPAYIWTIPRLTLNVSVLYLPLAFLFTAIAAAIVILSEISSSRRGTVLFVLIAAAAINIQVAYGIKLMDHHSLGRVEFKKAAIWYRDHYKNGDKMLMSEINVPVYYSKFDRSRFVEAFAIKASNLDQLVAECREKGITYAFIDDYYIRRLKVRDPNAVDRKAALFKELRDKGLQSGRFTLRHRFETKGGIVSYIYQYTP